MSRTNTNEKFTARGYCLHEKIAYTFYMNLRIYKREAFD